jgi:hypothetical protein
VDCTEDDKELCGKYGVKGFPTIQVFGADKKSPSKYESGRDADSIEAFVKNEASKGGDVASSKLVPEVTYVAMYDFLYSNKPKLPKVLLFTGEKGVPSWFKMLASSFKVESEEDDRTYKQGKVVATKKKKKVSPTIMFGAAASGDSPGAAQISKRFNVDEDARPAVFVCFGTHYTSYDGEFRKEDMKEFLDEYVGMEVPKAEDLPEGEWEKLPSFPEQSTPKVQVKKKESKGLTADNLYTTCLAQGHHLPVCSSSLTVRMDSTSLFPATYSSLCGTPRSTGGSLGLTNPRAWNPRSCPHRGGSQARTRPARRETPRQPPPRRPSTHPVAGMALSPPSSPLDRSSSTISLSSTKRLSVGGCVIQRDFISPASSMF